MAKPPPDTPSRIPTSPGTTVSERTYQAGFKVDRQICRIRPYADFLIGPGSITHDAFQDNSTVPSLGGLEYDLNDRWSLKADFQRQSWKLGSATLTFNPNTLTVGVAYRFHFGK